MKILIVSTLKRRVDSASFASRSRIIYELASGLAAKGHDVSLLGTADSNIPNVQTIPVIDKGWSDLPPVENNFLRETAALAQQVEKIMEVQGRFDIIHNHTYPDFFPSVVENQLTIPMVTTLHALYDYYMDDVLSQFPKTYFISLSDGYKKLYKKAKIYTTVYNGVDVNLYSFSGQKEDYLLWLGRLPNGRNKDGSFMDPKGVKTAIELAIKSGEKLLLGGGVEEREFFERDVKPYLNDKIQWVGEVLDKQSLPAEEVVKLMQRAKAFLMTVNQEEPFGLVMAEAMACGTPVIAYNRGSVSEVVRDGVTGFVIDPPSGEAGPDDEGRPGKGSWIIKKQGVEGLAEAVKRIGEIDKKACRQHVEENFTVEKMVDNYEKLYKEIIEKNKS